LTGFWGQIIKRNTGGGNFLRGSILLGRIATGLGTLVALENGNLGGSSPRAFSFQSERQIGKKFIHLGLISATRGKRHIRVTAIKRAGMVRGEGASFESGKLGASRNRTWQAKNGNSVWRYSAHGRGSVDTKWAKTR